jgi:putative SOS response-associated peptidase YedK
MCGRYVLVESEDGVRTMFIRSQDLSRSEWERLEREGRVLETTPPTKRPVFTPRYSVRPTDVMPIVTWDAGGRRQVESARWGLIPSWWKEPKPPRMATFNARAGSLASSGMWRGPFKRSRCLVPANGFYEWPVKGKGKPPVYIYRKDRRMFPFAGLADTWVSPETGEAVRSYTIITVEPNELMRPIHDRMPAMLDDEAVALWMDPLTEDPARLEAVLRPYPSELMAFHGVSAEANKAGADGPHLIEQAKQDSLF